MEKPFESLSFLHWLSKHFVSLLLVQVFALAVSIIFSSDNFIPREYKSSALIYPSNVADYSHESPSEQMMEFLNSTDIKNEVIARFDLRKRYNLERDGKPYLEKLYREYDNNVNVTLTEYGAIQLTAYDLNPDTAYEMVNSIINLMNKKIQAVQKEKFMEVVAMWKQQLNRKGQQLDSMTNVARQLSEQYGLLEYGNQTREVSRAYYQALGGGKGSKEFEEVAQQMKNMEDKGTEFRELNLNIESATTDYAGIEAKYEDALKDADRQFTYCNIVSAAYKPDTYCYPIRSLIVIGTCFAALVFSILFIRGFEKIKH